MAGIARKLLPVAEASAKLFGNYFGPHNIGRTGRKILMAPLKGPAIVEYYPPWFYSQTKTVWKYDDHFENKYWRNFRRWRKGHSVPKKGQGKKAQKRAKEAAKLAAAAKNLQK
jgi:hypothetical protein